MRALSLALAATTLSLAASLAPVAASATELKPMRPLSVDLGSFRGSAYYTVERDGYRVVATLAAAEDGAGQPRVIRLVTTLNGDQTVHLSVPGALGSDGRETTIAFKRRGDLVEVASAE